MSCVCVLWMTGLTVWYTEASPVFYTGGLCHLRGLVDCPPKEASLQVCMDDLCFSSVYIYERADLPHTEAFPAFCRDDLCPLRGRIVVD